MEKNYLLVKINEDGDVCSQKVFSTLIDAQNEMRYQFSAEREDAISTYDIVDEYGFLYECITNDSALLQVMDETSWYRWNIIDLNNDF